MIWKWPDFRNPLIGSGKRSNVNDTFKSERESEREFVTRLKEKFENPSSEKSLFYQRYKSLLSSNWNSSFAVLYFLNAVTFVTRDCFCHIVLTIAASCHWLNSNCSKQATATTTVATACWCKISFQFCLHCDKWIISAGPKEWIIIKCKLMCVK